ncbi:MAG: metal ABC transporter ATP-binding protein [Ignavibacteriales bacterium]|nr:metal ABC transporter ATP-binding protein [Ignavibacteriales bacterium]
MNSNDKLIEFRDVHLGYGRKNVLSRISFEIERSDFLGIVGPNGSGKTTLLRSILGILRPTAGEVRRAQNAVIGYVPQRDTIDPIMPFTVFDVVLMGRYGRLGLFRRPSILDFDKVQEALAHVNIEDLANRSFRDLSGGQKQRALIARALVTQPDILVLDEPTNGMDLASRSSTLELIKHLHKDDKLTVIMVSHLLSDVANYVNRIAIVEDRYFQVGRVGEILTDSNLSKLYGVPVTVGDFQGNKIVVAGGKNV